MEAEGVTFCTGVDIGKDISPKELLDQFDAVALCTGAKNPRPLQAEGMQDNLKGVYYAVDFLKMVTKSVIAKKGGRKTAKAQSSADPAALVKGKHVIVLGGGDTGNDCVGSVIRLGCKSVTQLEMMPQPPVGRLESNPWPEWPKVLKTDYGQEEAIAVFGKDPRIYTTTVKALHGKAGKLKSAEIVQVGFDQGKLVQKAGTEQTLPCDLLLIAAGFIGCQPYTAEAFGVPLTGRGTTATPEGSYRTGVEKVFTAGDMHRGQSLVVWAIAEGRGCALEIDRYLMGYTDMDV